MDAYQLREKAALQPALPARGDDVAALLASALAHEPNSQHAFRNRQLACRHCGNSAVIRWGASHGLPRFRCVSCKRTFNILTNTSMSRLRHKERWLTFLGTMIEQKSVRGSAASCKVDKSTVLRWRGRFKSCTHDQRMDILMAVVMSVASRQELNPSVETLLNAKSWMTDLVQLLSL